MGHLTAERSVLVVSGGVECQVSQGPVQPLWTGGRPLHRVGGLDLLPLPGPGEEDGRREEPLGQTLQSALPFQDHPLGDHLDGGWGCVPVKRGRKPNRVEDMSTVKQIHLKIMKT